MNRKCGFTAATGIADDSQSNLHTNERVECYVSIIYRYMTALKNLGGE
jgi:hypothetical protein